MIFLWSFISKFGSSLARPVFWREGKMDLVGPSRNIICFIHFLLVGDFSFIRGCRKHECTWFKINSACFYCLLGLEIIGCSNKGLWIRPFLHMLTQFHSTRRPILMLRFHLKSVFVSRLGNIYCYFWIFRVPGTSWYRFYLCVDQTRPAKSCSYLVLFVYVSSGRLLLTYRYLS